MGTEVQVKDDYFAMPAKDLLEEFGKGSHIPGSGSAAAFSALLAVELMRTVAILTRTKEEYNSVHGTMEYIKDQIDNKYKPLLVNLFHSDVKEFAEVSKLRRLRDGVEKGSKEYKAFAKAESDQMKKATEIPLEICKISLELMPLSLELFDKGYKATRGDAGVAISNVIASISGSLFVVMLNIRTRRKSRWVNEMRQEAERHMDSINVLQKEAFSRVTDLYIQGLPDDQPQLPFKE